MSNRRTFRNAVLFLTAIFCFTWILVAPAEEPREFTSEDGRSIRAVLLRVEGETAVIRRAADGKEFALPIARLSAEDRAWIRKWVESRPQPLPGDWSRLRVELPSPRGRIGVVGMDDQLAGTEMGAGVFDLMIPKGAWIEVTDYPEERSIVVHLLRFEGEERWRLKFFGDVLLLSRDSGPFKVAGLTIPVREEERKTLFGRLNNEPIEEFISVCWWTGGLKASDLKGLKSKIGAVIPGSGKNRADYVEIARLRPKAVKLQIGAELLGVVADFEDLEGLFLWWSSSRNAGDNEENVLELNLVGSPALRDLTLKRFPLTDGLTEALAGLGKLRLLNHSGLSREEGGPSVGVGRITSLEGLHLSGQGIDPEHVANLKQLKSLSIAYRSISEGDPALAHFTRITGLLKLSIGESDFPSGVWRQWVGNGGLKELRKIALRWYDTTGIETLTNLEVAEFSGGISGGGAPVKVADLGGLKSLNSLTLSDVNDSDIKALAALPNREGIQALKMSDGTYGDLKPLAGLSGLTHLNLFGSNGSTAEVDLGWFPALKAFGANGMDNLVFLSGVSAHPNLAVLKIRNCDKLENLGEKTPNATLRHLDLSLCPSLGDITGLHGTSGLRYLQITECDALKEPLVLDQNNEIASLRVTRCAGLDQR